MRLAAAFLLLAALVAPALALDYLTVDVAGADGKAVAALRADRAVTRYLELGDHFVVACPEGRRPKLPAQARYASLPVRPDLPEPVLATRRGAASPLDECRALIHVLHETGPYTLLQATPEILGRLERAVDNHFRLESFDRNLRLLVPADREFVRSRRAGSGPAADPKRIAAAVVELQDFKTRHSYTPGYGRSAQRMAERFRALGMSVTFHEYNDSGRPQKNVVAQFPGNETGPFYLLGAHLDSTSPDPQNNAPGADDNASGAAGALEVATLLAQHPKANRLRFVLFAGEEVGLRGSTAYAKELAATGEIKRCLGAVIFDMIAWDRRPPLSTLVETRDFAKPFIQGFVDAARAGGLAVTINYNPWGSDHVPFLRQNVPTFLFIEDEFESNTNYHQTSDLAKDCNFELSAGMCRAVAGELVRILEK